MAFEFLVDHDIMKYHNWKSSKINIIINIHKQKTIYTTISVSLMNIWEIATFICIHD